MAAGETVECTFTNTAQPGSITVVKQLVGAVPTSDWQFTGTLGALTLPAAGGQQAFNNLNAGNYTITETTKTGYSASVNCTNGASGTSSVTVSLQAGQNVTCTFTNTKLDLLILQGNGNCLALDLTAGRYTFKTPTGIYTGPLTFTRSGNTINFRSGRGDNKLLGGKIDLGRRSGTAVLVLPRSLGGRRFSITDRNIDDNGPCP